MQASRRGVLGATILGSSMVFIDGTLVNVILPKLQETFHATGAQIQWVVEAYTLFLSALILVGGALGDRYGRKRIYEYGTFIFVAASIACGLSRTLWQLTLARAIQGIGGALLTPGSLAIINAVFPEKERGRAIGTWSGSSAMATALGPVLGGYLSDNFSWRWAFFINVPIAALTIALSRKFLPTDCKETGTEALDLPGALTSTLGLTGLTVALIEAGRVGLRNGMVSGLLVASVVLLALFLLIEARNPRAMMPFELFRARQFSGANAFTLFLYAAMGAAFYFLPFYLIQIQGFTAIQAGAANLPFIAIMFVFSRWTGGLYDRVGARIPLTIGALIAGTGLVLLGALSNSNASYWRAFFPGIATFGLGVALCVSPLTTAALGAIPVERSGVASGINNSVARCGGLLAVAVATLLMLSTFRHHLREELEPLPIDARIKNALIVDSSQLAALSVPETAPAALKPLARRSIELAYVRSFKEIMFFAAILTFAAAGVAFFALR